MSDETVYVRNEEGAVHSVTREHYDHYLVQTTNAGRTYPLPGWSLITEDEARQANPQLFGEWDDRVVYTDDEVARMVARQKALDEWREGQRKPVNRSRGTKTAD